MSKSIYIDAHASVSRPHTRKPYHHPWWRHAYGWYERSIDNLREDFPLGYWILCGAMMVIAYAVFAMLAVM